MGEPDGWMGQRHYPTGCMLRIAHSLKEVVSLSNTAAGAPQKTVGIAYLLWFFLGALGAHQFYLGRTGRAVSYIFTFGWLGVGLLIDLFTMSKQVRIANGAPA
jgi:TM2 domain